MDNWIILYIVCACIVWEKYAVPIGRILVPLFRKVGKPFTCGKCLSLWVTLAVTHNIGMACVSFVAATIILRLYESSTV